MSLEVIPCGTKVELILGKFAGIVNSISISFNKISYEIKYVHDGKYQTTWANELEFDTLAKINKTTIGFKP